MILFSVNSFAQIIMSNDTIVCGSFNDTLYALSSDASGITADDGHGPVISIGFTFNFYGVPYTQLVISGNGYITFDLSQANQYSPWSITTPIPNPGILPENAILAPWQDLNPSIGGDILYEVVGFAPNRMFIVTWCATPLYSCSNLLHTSQVVLYEGSDKIEMFIQNKPLCTSWNGGAAIQGLVDATSTSVDIVDDPLYYCQGIFLCPGMLWHQILRDGNSFQIAQRLLILLIQLLMFRLYLGKRLGKMKMVIS